MFELLHFSAPHRLPGRCFLPSRRWLLAAAAPVVCGLLLLLRPAAARAEPQGFGTVIIDAGHGGHDRGGSPGQRGIAEKIVTLDTAQRLQKILRNRGLRTIMTRDGDYFVPLGQRVGATAGRSNAVFVSVHFNGAPREGASGIETYYYRGDSFGLAERMHRSILAATGAEDRWVRRRGFYVIRNSRVPAVLCELGFLTNTDEENRIAHDGGYRQKLAQGIASAILSQRSEGDPDNLGAQPPITSERLGSRRNRRGRRGRYYHASSRSSRSGRHGRSSARSSRSSRGKKSSSAHSRSSSGGKRRKRHHN
jgi:N-acetylmuramoyl-L-alanine amidase